MMEKNPEKKDRWFVILWIIIFLTGILFMLYPKIAKIWNAGKQSLVVDGYEKNLDHLSRQTEEKLIAQTRAYNEMILAQQNPVPNDKNAEEYGKILSMSANGVIGYLEIPSINVRLPIYHGSDSASISNGVGHVEGSSFPIGGEGTHAVLSSHRGLPGAKLFSDLDKLKVGDLFSVTVLHQTLFYEIDRIDIVEPEETQLLQIEKGRDYCTLLTCTPYGVNTKRLLVRGVRCHDTKKAEPIHTGEQKYRKWQRVIWISFVLVLCILCLKRKRRK